MLQSSLAGEHHKSCKAVTTLRSGKIIEKPDLLSKEQQENDLQQKEKDLGQERMEEEDKEEKDELNWRSEIRDSASRRPTAPYPERLINKGKDTVDQQEIYDVFSKCQVNLPLLTAIRQIPRYARYLKELCTIKRKLHVRKKSFLAENVSAIVQNAVRKMSDPGSPTIPCVIGTTQIEHALLDLGSSVNLLPFHIFEEIGLLKLKPTTVTLQLADGSVVVPEGKIEDVIVKVQDFYFPVDFIVLNIERSTNSKPAPIILGRSFLATSDAHIGCRDGSLKLTFGNMSLDMNIYNSCNNDKKC